MKPFDPEAALRGNPVRLRDGRKATLVKRRGEESSYPLIGEHEFPPESGNYIEDYWTEGGGYYVNGESSYDIVGMWDEGPEAGSETPPFDLGAALAGAPVTLRNGRIAFVEQYMGGSVAYPLLGGIELPSEPDLCQEHAWAEDGRSHSCEAELDIVGMWDGEPEASPKASASEHDDTAETGDVPTFDLEAALAGTPVRLGDGRKAFVRTNTREKVYPLHGWIMPFNESAPPDEARWTESGKYYVSRGSDQDIIGMWEDLPPFNLEAALNGAPVRLRDGLKAWVRYHETITEAGGFPLWGFIDGANSKTPMSWTAEGRHVPHFEPHSYDIVGMWVEPEPVFEHWGMLSPGFVSMEKHSDAGVQWWVVRPREGRSMILIENDFAPGFFPDVPIGTVIRRPTVDQP